MDKEAMDKACLEDPYLFLEKIDGEWYACYYRRRDRKNPPYKVEKIDTETQESDDELPR
tara:strand:- start:17856 stop:18032 length:177 start_codon:yes stop_codon:yes gene_type:complete